MATQDNIDAIKSLTDAAYPNVRNDTVSQLDATNALIELHQEDYYDLFNADTAKRLKTPRLIGGVPFDGTTDIVLPGVNAKGNQDTSGHAASADNANHANDSDKSLLADEATALKTPRKINGVEFDGTSDININSSNAEVANKLKTPRLIGGVPFDGRTDIVLPGVNSKGNQDTSGHAASADTANSSNNASHANKADSAVKLQTPRKINGTNFDGTADINVPASNDSDIVHKSGNETIIDDKNFTGTTSLSNGTSITTKTANVTSKGLSVNFIETAFGVEANITESGNTTLPANDAWGVLGNIPETISTPKQSVFTSTNVTATIGGVTRTNFLLILSFNTNREINYRLILTRENNNTTTYVPVFRTWISANWFK